MDILTAGMGDVGAFSGSCGVGRGGGKMDYTGSGVYGGGVSDITKCF